MQRDTYVLLSWASDPMSGETYRIDDPFVQRGKASGLVCGECGELLVAKQGDERAWHFAHLSSGQIGEGCRHWNAVWELYHRIKGAMQQEEGVPFRWQCKECRREHTGDFVQGATSVYREMLVPTKEVKPDISLYNGDVPHRFIEVVDTNPPKEHVREYARKRDVNLVVVRVKDNSDLNGIIKAEVWEGSVCPTPPARKSRFEAFHAAPKRQPKPSDAEAANPVVLPASEEMPEHVLDLPREGGKRRASPRILAHTAVIPANTHRVCPYCKEDVTQKYFNHYCCYWTNRFGLPLCADRNQATHGHCTKCGARTGLGYGACRLHYSKG